MRASARATRLTSFALVPVLALQATLAFAQKPATGPATSPPPAPVAAPPTQTPAQQAAALKLEGNEALGALRPGDALAAYRKAYALTPEPALHYNMGHALEALGDYPGALAEYEEFARVAPPDLKARVPRLAELIAEVRARVTVVTLRCNVSGARVLVRDVAVGAVGPDGSFSHAFPAGPATFEITSEGYAAHHQQVVFERGGEATFNVTLVTKSTAAILKVTTTPVPGDVYIDDKAVGQAPVEDSVTAGTHRIVVRRSGLRETTTQVVVDVGETKEITIDLEKTTPIYAHWWFWAGVGAVVVAGAVITYAGFKARAADTGSISPGQTSTGSLLQF